MYGREKRNKKTLETFRVFLPSHTFGVEAITGDGAPGAQPEPVALVNH
jgi:hypothetical protein